MIINIVSNKGFFSIAQLLCKAGAATGDYHGQMNSTNFETWINE
jgi:hypothetical protein